MGRVMTEAQKKTKPPQLKCPACGESNLSRLEYAQMAPLRFALQRNLDGGLRARQQHRVDWNSIDSGQDKIYCHTCRDYSTIPEGISIDA